MNKVSEIKIYLVEMMPEVLDNGILYVSHKYHITIHLCACGCGVKTVTPLGLGGWRLTGTKDELYTLRPSIGNFTGESPYHAHYYITDNKIEWL